MRSERRFRPMGIRDILDETFDLYKSNFAALLAIVAVVQVREEVKGRRPVNPGDDHDRRPRQKGVRVPPQSPDKVKPFGPCRQHGFQ